MSNLYNKYVVTKADGSPVATDAQYFVLRIDTDPAARAALLVYADQIKDSDPEFAKELQAWVWVYTENASNKVLQSDTAYACPDCGSESLIDHHWHCPRCP